MNRLTRIDHLLTCLWCILAKLLTKVLEVGVILPIWGEQVTTWRAIACSVRSIWLKATTSGRTVRHLELFNHIS